MKAKFICFLLALGVTMSCDDDDIATDCDRTISIITEYIDDFKLQTVDLYIDNSLHSLDQPFRIEDSFISINGTRFNLCFLKGYSRDDNSVTLYF